MSVVLLLVSATLVAAAATASGAGKDADLVCSACRVLLAELHSKVEEEAAGGRMMESGSFRVDSRGEQRVTKIPFARSDTHVTQLLEAACHGLGAYGRLTLDDGQRGFASLTRDDGRPVDNGRLVSGSSVDNWLRMRCDSFIDDHEEELKSLLRQQPPLSLQQLQYQFCASVASVCTSDQLQLQFDPPVDLQAEAKDKEAEANGTEAEANGTEAEAKDTEAEVDNTSVKEAEKLDMKVMDGKDEL